MDGRQERPDGQAAKTTPSHGVNPGSIPGQVITESNRYSPVAFFVERRRTFGAARGRPMPECFRENSAEKFRRKISPDFSPDFF